MIQMVAQAEEIKLYNQFQPHPISSHHSFVRCDVILKPTFFFFFSEHVSLLNSICRTLLKKETISVLSQDYICNTK